MCVCFIQNIGSSYFWYLLLFFFRGPKEQVRLRVSGVGGGEGWGVSGVQWWKEKIHLTERTIVRRPALSYSVTAVHLPTFQSYSEICSPAWNKSRSTLSQTCVLFCGCSMKPHPPAPPTGPSEWFRWGPPTPFLEHILDHGCPFLHLNEKVLIMRWRNSFIPWSSRWSRAQSSPGGRPPRSTDNNDIHSSGCWYEHTHRRQSQWTIRTSSHHANTKLRRRTRLQWTSWRQANAKLSAPREVRVYATEDFSCGSVIWTLQL